MEMTRQKLMQLLDELIEECHTRGIEGTIAIYGGTAMVYYVPELRTTQDVDSMFRPFSEIQSAAEVVGNRNNVPNNWLNMDDNPEVYSDANGLKVTFASKKYLLAMKAMSDRRSQKDLDDAAVLFNALRLKNWMGIDEIVHQYYGVESAGAQELFFEDIEDRADEIRK